MSYTFLLDAEAESSAESFEGIPASVLSRLNLTAVNPSCSDSAMESFQSAPSGMTSPPLTANRGVERLTQFAADFRAKILVLPAAAKVLPGSEADSGTRCAESFAKWNPESSSWKTHQFSLLGGLESFLETWPRWGSMQNGECYPLPMPSGLMELRAWITSEIESGFWQRMETPTADDISERQPSQNFVITKTGRARHVNPNGVQSQERLSQLVKRLQTPTVQDANGRDRHNQKDGSVILSLLGAARRMATPQASERQQQNSKDDWASLSAQVKRMPTVKASAAGPDFAKMDRSATGISLQTAIALEQPDTGGQLNPEWVEWFMGWPIGMTALQPLEMGKFQQWLRSHGIY